jgi:hypothetical protein
MSLLFLIDLGFGAAEIEEAPIDVGIDQEVAILPFEQMTELS